MPYQAPIQRTDPTALLFLVDQSSSMGDRMAGSERTKAQIVADVLNKTLMQLVTRCAKADGIRDDHYIIKLDAVVLAVEKGDEALDIRAEW